VTGLERHAQKMHPAPPPPVPAPKRTTTWAVSELSESFTLVGGDHLDVGDVFWHHRKFVIKKNTRTEGSAKVEVYAECTKKHWSQDQPIGSASASTANARRASTKSFGPPVWVRGGVERASVPFGYLLYEMASA
jgi:hypothetical protein